MVLDLTIKYKDRDKLLEFTHLFANTMMFEERLVPKYLNDKQLEDIRKEHSDKLIDKPVILAGYWDMTTDKTYGYLHSPIKTRLDLEHYNFLIYRFRSEDYINKMEKTEQSMKELEELK